MAVFKVKLGSSDGAVLERQARGHSSHEVKARFQHEGYFVFSVKRTLEPANFLGFGRRVAAKPFILFNKEMRSLIKAGLPVVEGLDLLLGRMRHKRLAELITRVRDRLIQGESLSEAFAANMDMVPRYYPALLHAGEQSGNLVEVLDRFIAQEERIRKARKKFRQAMTYPTILLVAAMVALYLILTRAMPEFASLYTGAQRELPAITQVVMGASQWLTTWYLHLFVVLAIAAGASLVFLRTERGALQGERMLRRVPVVGKLWVLQNQNIFARSMRLLLAGGLPVPKALSIIAGATPSRLLGKELNQVHSELQEGKSLQAALDQHAYLTPMAGEMIRVGEATGSLDEMFEHVAEHGEEQAEDVLETVSGLIAPIMLVLIGLLIAFLVIAMYLPMFGSYEALGG